MDNCHSQKASPFYKSKIFLISIILLSLVLLSFAFPFLVSFRESLWMYFRIIWWALLLGLILGGTINHFVPHEYVSSVLASPKKRTIFYAVTLGLFSSVCNHGILALAIQLYKKGASTSSVITYLMASPWANLPITLMLFSFFGIYQAIYIIFVALFIAVTTGFIYQLMEKKGTVESNPNSVIPSDDFSVFSDMKSKFKNYSFTLNQTKQDLKGVWEGALSLSKMVLGWILLGMGLASFAGAYIPHSFFESYMGPTFFGMLVTLGLATVLEVCSDGMAPLAFEIFRQTGALGNSFVFLMAGVATDYTEIGLLWTNIGKRTAILLPLITVPQILLFGVIANYIF